MSCGINKRRGVVPWVPLPPGLLKFNVVGTARGKSGSTGIRGVLRDDEGEVLCLFSKGVEIRDSNEAKVLDILKARRILSHSFHGILIVESDSSNTISRVSPNIGKPWKLHFYFSEINSLVYRGDAVFCHVL